MTASIIGSNVLANQSAIHPHLGKGYHGVIGEVADLRRTLAATLGVACVLIVEEFTAPAAASTTAIMAATATVTAGVTYSVAAGTLNDLSGTTFLVAARNVTITTGGGTPANAPVSAVITGFNAAGKAQTETITPSTSAGTVAGVKGWSKVTSVTFGTAGGTAATVAIGYGAVIGLKELPMARTGQTVTAFAPFKELVDAAAPTAGTLDGTNQTYTPNSAPNGTHRYAVYYECNGTAIPDA